jgi:hypothetical protein
MSVWESIGKSDEWYTPRYIFDALGETFDLDVAAPEGGGPHVPTVSHYSSGSLQRPWTGFIWMNPPFGGQNGLIPWLGRFFDHSNGIALTPDRTSAEWWLTSLQRADATMFLRGRVKFERPDGTIGKSPSNGTTLFAAGERAVEALLRAEGNGLGIVT